MTSHSMATETPEAKLVDGFTPGALHGALPMFIWAAHFVVAYAGVEVACALQLHRFQSPRCISPQPLALDHQRGDDSYAGGADRSGRAPPSCSGRIGCHASYGSNWRSGSGAGRRVVEFGADCARLWNSDLPLHILKRCTRRRRR